MPNVDGLRWFIKDVWPLVLARGVSSKLIIAGADAPVELTKLANSTTHFLGHVPDIEPIFGTARLSIAPIRYGAGLKGKVVTSLGYGVPVIGTSVAFEGSGLQHGRNVIEANTEDEFAAAIEAIYDDESKWQRLSSSGLAAWNSLFSLETGRRRVACMLNELNPEVMFEE